MYSCYYQWRNELLLLHNQFSRSTREWIEETTTPIHDSCTQSNTLASSVHVTRTKTHTPCMTIILSIQNALQTHFKQNLQQKVYNSCFTPVNVHPLSKWQKAWKISHDPWLLLKLYLAFIYVHVDILYKKYQSCYAFTTLVHVSACPLTDFYFE